MHVGDSLRGVAVPERRWLAGARAALGERRRDAGDRGRVEAEQGVGAGADRHRALGVVAQGEAGDAEVGRLLLDPAGVGEDGAGVGEQREEVEVAERLGEHAGPGCSAPASLHHLAGPRVDREDDRHLARRAPPSCGHRLGQQRPVDEGRAVQGDEHVAAGLDAERARRRRRRGSGPRARPGCRSSCCRRSASRSSAMPSARRFSIASSRWRKR